METSTPRVIVLNGIPCSGKSTLARSFQDRRIARGELWLHVELDTFEAMLPVDGHLAVEQYRAAAASMVASVASLPRSGVNLLVELVLRTSDLSASAVLRDLFQALMTFDPLLASVLVSRDVALAREAHRRPVRRGLVQRDIDVVSHEHYDVSLSTDKLRPDEAAALLEHSLETCTGSACKRLLDDAL